MAAKPRHRRRWIDLFGRRSDLAALTMPPLGPRRLEPRRMLDAAAPALVLELFDAGSEFVQVAADAPPAEEPFTSAALSGNTNPANLQIQPPGGVDENGVASLKLTFDDPDAADTHIVAVNWGDGPTEFFNVLAGSRSFDATHQYLDDDPTGTPVDPYTINVKVIDSAGGSAVGSAAITVGNVAPSNLQIAPPGPIDENGVGSLKLSFDDPGTRDAHTVIVNWGDGSEETFTLPQGSRSLDASHQYLDDDPTGTAADDYPISVRVLDDDGGEGIGATQINVRNVAPSNVQFQPIAPIDEHGVAQLALSFDDPGTLDGHTVEIDWGDGSPLESLPVAAGARTFTANHQYLDDNPTGTASDSHSVTVRVLDDDGGEAAAGPVAALVGNVPPSGVTIDPLAPIDENGVAVLKLAFNDPGTQDVHTVEVDWGDGTPLELLPVAAGARTFTANHQYLDDQPGAAPDSYVIKVRVFDDDLGVAAASETIVMVANVPPHEVQISPPAVSILEGGAANLLVEFADPGTLDSHTYEVDWGDGTVATVGTAVGHSFSVSHTYADDGVYKVTVKVADDDAGVGMATANVTVSNVAPTLSAVGNQAVNEGTPLSLVNVGQFTDPGFDNPLNPLAEKTETFDYTIDWGDGTTISAGVPGTDVPGSPGVLTAGSFDGAHTYADDGVYTVTVTVRDDDGGQDVKSFTVTVSNVAPTLSAVGNQAVNEGTPLSLVNIGQFTDPGFDNPLSPLAEKTETFTYTIDWGDGTTISAGVPGTDVPGSPGVLTAGSFDGSHTYADDGVYTVTVTVRDDDGGQDVKSFTVTVSNVAPTLAVVGAQTVNEGTLLSLVNIGQFTDPGFDNPLSPLAEKTETFTYTIDWGDGTTISAGVPGTDVPGSPGVLTAGSFDGSHTYADDGVYTVTVTVRDDDGGQDVKSFTVTVSNVAPTLAVVGAQTVNEGTLLSLVNIGQFTDPGFDNPLNPLSEKTETFTYTIDWGDGTTISSGVPGTDVPGSPGVLTAGSFDGSHTYADDGVYTVTVTVRDDDGGQDVKSFTVTVSNVAPTLSLTVDESLILPIDEGGVTEVNLTGVFRDPGFDNPNNTAFRPDGGPPETAETFTYEVDWGDGHTYGPFTLADANGSPGVDSTGTIAQFFSHQYIDNDLDGVRDARYTVTVTVYDDDGGASVRTFEVIVYNVNPTLSPIAATDVNNQGETTLTLTFDDPGATGVETFEILIDWGDRLTTADPLERFVVESPYDGSTPQTFVFTHTYTEPPDPLHPAADIVMSVKIRDDDFGTATSRPDADPTTIDGQSNIETVAVTNPGLGAEPFRIDTTPEVALLTFPERAVTAMVINAQEARLSGATSGDVGGSAGDSKAASERYLELRVMHPDGTLSEGYRLRPEVLDNLPALFRNLPDNHYAIYLVQSETSVRRLVIDVFVRNGKVIDPGDDSEGARDRPPTDEAAPAPAEKPAETPPAAPSEELPAVDEAATSSAVEPAVPGRVGGASSTAVYHRVTLAGVALALSSAGRDWQRELQQALVKAKPGEWKRLRTAGHRRRRRPR